MSEPLTSPQLRAWYALLQGHARLIRRLARELADETGLTLDVYEILAFLSAAEGRRLPVGALCDVVNLSLSGVSRLVDKLEAGGMVRRERRTDDARVVDVVLTDGGMRALEAAYPVHVRGVRQYFAEPAGDDRLQVLAEAMEAVREAAGPPSERGAERGQA